VAGHKVSVLARGRPEIRKKVNTQSGGGSYIVGFGVGDEGAKTVNVDLFPAGDVCKAVPHSGFQPDSSAAPCDADVFEDRPVPPIFGRKDEE
jgi:hypothetical protein